MKETEIKQQFNTILFEKDKNDSSRVISYDDDISIQIVADAHNFDSNLYVKICKGDENRKFDCKIVDKEVIIRIEFMKMESD